VLTVDLHAGQIQGFFNIPVDELTALYILSRHFEEKQLDDLVVVATDIGISKRARDMAARLNTPLAIIEKRRLGNIDLTQTFTVIGDVEGRLALLVDDEVDTGGSISSAASALLEHGAKEIYACCTHAILSGPAVERIANSPLKEMVVTDSIPVPESKQIDKLTVLPLAALIGEAIHRIHANLSIGAMFQ
jgi:ribose-phosphate pyrophosphokinase